jgi:uncharacterized protein
MRSDLLEGARLFNAGEYWEAHEAWEVPWNAAKARGDAAEASYIQGLILLAAAIHKRRHYANLEGGRRNFEKATRRFEGLSPTHSARDGFDLEALKLEVKAALEDDGLRPQLPLGISALEVLRRGWVASFAGAREGGWFSGLFETLETVNAETASRSVRANGSTVAAHLHHLWFCMRVIRERLEGDPLQANWDEEWAVRTVDDTAWATLRMNLRDEYERTLTWLETTHEPANAHLEMVMDDIAHAAYHVGAARQILVNLT